MDMIPVFFFKYIGSMLTYCTNLSPPWADFYPAEKNLPVTMRYRQVFNKIFVFVLHSSLITAFYDTSISIKYSLNPPEFACLHT